MIDRGDGATSFPSALDARERNRRRSFRAFVCTAGGFLGLFAVFVLGESGPVLALSMLSGLGAFVALPWHLTERFAGAPRLVARRVSIDGDVLCIEGIGDTPFADVTQGCCEDPNLVRLTLANGRVVVLAVDNPVARARLLSLAGVSADARTLRVDLVSAASQIAGGSFLGGVLLVALVLALVFAIIVLAIAVGDISSGAFDKLGAFTLVTFFTALLGLGTYALGAALRRREVTIGTDGIAYRRTLSTEFIPYTTLASVVRDTRGVRLVRKRGRSVLLPTRSFGQRPLPLASDVAGTTVGSSPEAARALADRRLLIERIREAMAVGGGADAAQVALDRLDRNGQTVDAWRASLAAAARDGDYRAARLTPDDLAAVIQDPSAPADRRVGAALTLARVAPDEARRRVRVATQACADDALRQALEAAAEGDVLEAELDRIVRRA